MKKPETPFSLRLVETEKEWLEKQADAQERSMNWIVRNLIKEAMKNEAKQQQAA
ncbi:hypothetical protein LIN78_12135 [Leeia sp. TBRC 13508]|uniref:Arc-like DNA binding domain-containing protein n=1 Tax=Leeia speluncae TaxID=2884804 RepID=A0ABS8D7X8_9NEIS|nr:hypothetical protein [Leeia speluncae]MCB6184294.1 hypothetical protein [Leeia speluncae]